MDESAESSAKARPTGPVDRLPDADEPATAAPGDTRTRRFDLRGRTLRQFTARGTVINAAFMVGLSVLGLLKGFVLAIFLAREDYGLWGLLIVSLGTILWLKQIGIGDKFIQQDETDQEAAFQKAFTLEFLSSALFIAILAGVLPLYCLAYDQWKMLAPGYVIIFLVLPSTVLRTPLWVYYRQMRFARQRALQAIDPIVGFVVSVGLAVAGMGYWAFVGGALAGAWAVAIASVVNSPYRLRFRYDGATLRQYWSFSWPLFIASGSSLLVAQGAVVATEAHLGLAAAGVITLASNITQFTHRVSHLVTGSMYPAICAVRERVDLLQESFVKSNRLALIWAMPFGLGLALFCGDLVSYVIGEKWRPAVAVLQVYGIVAAVSHIAFNWDAYFRARGETRPMAIAATAAMVTFFAAGLPLLFLWGLRGLAIGVGLQALAHIACRAYFLRRLFDGFSYLGHATRAMLPIVPAVTVVLVLRTAVPWERTGATVLGELALYILLVVAVTWQLERGLVREAVGYVVRRPTAAAAT